MIFRLSIYLGVEGSVATALFSDLYDLLGDEKCINDIAYVGLHLFVAYVCRCSSALFYCSMFIYFFHTSQEYRLYLKYCIALGSECPVSLL